MNSYLNAKLILFKEILNKKSVIISDKILNHLKYLKKYLKRKKLKLLNNKRN